ATTATATARTPGAMWSSGSGDEGGGGMEHSRRNSPRDGPGGGLDMGHSFSALSATSPSTFNNKSNPPTGIPPPLSPLKRDESTRSRSRSRSRSGSVHTSVYGSNGGGAGGGGASSGSAARQQQLHNETKHAPMDNSSLPVPSPVMDRRRRGSIRSNSGAPFWSKEPADE
ncbi:unnamed protein product, partial [Sphacelaria rigidula]